MRGGDLLAADGAAARKRPERVAIVGSQRFRDMQAVRAFVNALPEMTVVVSGGAPGVDTVAEQAARERCLPTAVWPANWKKYGKSAGHRRNPFIVDDGDRVEAFWDGTSPGTAGTIEISRKRGKPVTIHREFERQPAATAGSEELKKSC